MANLISTLLGQSNLMGPLYDMNDNFIKSSGLNSKHFTANPSTALQQQFNLPDWNGEKKLENANRPVFGAIIRSKDGTVLGNNLVVLDSDTFEIWDTNNPDKKPLSVRLMDIDGREVVHKAGGTPDVFACAQSAAGAELIKYNLDQGNNIVIDAAGKDGHGRIVANVVFQDKAGNTADYSYLMVKNGLVSSIKRIPKQASLYPFEAYTKAEAKAKEQRIGIHGSEALPLIKAEDKAAEKRHNAIFKYDGEYNTKNKTNREFDLDNERYSNKVKIGDVWLDIPPTHLSIGQIRSTNQTQIIGFETKPTAVPVSRITFKTNLIFSGKDRINTDLKRIITQFRLCPFNLIRSKDIWTKLSNSKDAKNPIVSLLAPYRAGYYIPVTMDEYTLYTIDGHPETLGCSIQMSLFNYFPYYEGSGKFTYYKYINKSANKAANINDLFAPTDILELSTHPYNAVIEEICNPKEGSRFWENKFEYDEDSESPSKIMICKIDKSISEKEVNKREADKDRSLTAEEFLSKVNESTVKDIASSISVAYRNNFAWQPVSGYANPTPQYLGPGTTYISVNIKTKDSSNISRLLRTYHEKVKENEYGFYDDRYIVSSLVTNFADVSVASISDIVITSLDGHPGWSDINLQLVKSSFEFDVSYNGSAIEMDKYWGLQRIAALAEHPEVEKVLKGSRADNSPKPSTTLDRMARRDNSVDVINMDADARAAINRELRKYTHGDSRKEEQLYKLLMVSEGKSSADNDVIAGAIRDWINNYTIMVPATHTGDFATDEYNRYQTGDNVKKVSKRVPFPYKDRQKLLTEAARTNPTLKAYLGSYDDKTLALYADKYATPYAQYKADGTVIHLQYFGPKESRKAFFDELKNLGVFHTSEFSHINWGEAGNKNGFDENSIVVRYTVNQEVKHQIAARKEADAFREKQKALMKLDLTKIYQSMGESLPLAAHRYWPDISNFIQASPLYSATVGEWYYTDKVKNISYVLSKLQNEVSEAVSPIRDIEAYRSIYMKEKWPGLYDKVNDKNDPMTPLEALSYPANRRDYVQNNTGKMVNVLASNEPGNHPYAQWQPGALSGDWGSFWGSDEEALKLNQQVYDAGKKWINNYQNFALTTKADQAKALAEIYDASRNKRAIENANGVFNLPSQTLTQDLHPELLKTKGYWGGTEWVSATGESDSLYSGVAGKMSSALKTMKEQSFNIGCQKNPKGTLAKLGKGKNVTKEAAKIKDKTVQKMTEKKDKAMENVEYKLSTQFLAAQQSTNGMENAFPTFKLYVISEDTSDIRFFSLDDYYDYRLVQDLMVIRDKNNPLHILKARVVVDPRYVTTNPRVNPNATRSGNRELNTETYSSLDTLDTENQKLWDGGRSPLREGMRVSLKIGYHSDPRMLDTVFIGTIVSLNGSNNMGVYEIECHGDGRELTQPANKNNITYKGENFAGIMSQILKANTNVIHFGRVYGSFLERFSRKHYSLIELAKTCVWPAGLFTGNVAAGTAGAMMEATTGISYFKWLPKIAFSAKVGIPLGIVMLLGSGTLPAASRAIATESGRRWEDFTFNQNVLTSTRFSDLQGWFKGNTFNYSKAAQQMGQIYHDTWKGDNNPVDDNIYAVDIWQGSTKCELTINNKKSIWEVFKDIQRMYPGYALDIRPYGNRSTIYLGHPAGEYWRTDDPLKAMAPHLNVIGGQYRLNEAQLSTLNQFEPQLDKNYMIGNTEDIAPRIPFQKQHIATSFDNIILNGIKGTPYRGWNSVVVHYSKSTDPAKANESDTINLSADSELDPGAVRTQYVNADFTDDSRLAKFYGLGYLKEGVEKMYGGTLILKGNSKIEPYDTIYIYDEINKMYGWVQVEAVIHKLDSEMGFTTHIVPNMLCDINEDAYMTFMDVAKRYMWENKKKAVIWGLDAIGTAGSFFMAETMGASLALTGAAYFATTLLEKFWVDADEKKPTGGAERAMPESEEATKYITRSIDWTMKANAMKYGMYVGMIAKYLRAGVKWKKSKAERTIKGGAERLYKSSVALTSRTSSAWKGVATALGEEASTGKVVTAVAAKAAKKLGSKATIATEKAIDKGSKALKHLGKVGTVFTIASVIETGIELIPLAFDLISVKATTEKNAIIVHPLWSHGRIMMQGLEGYRNNDIWMHAKNVMINARRNLTSAWDSATNYYKDVSFGIAPTSVGEAIASTNHTPSQKEQDYKRHELISSESFVGLNDAAIRGYMRTQLVKANNITSEEANNIISIIDRERNRYTNKTPWVLIAATMSQESSFLMWATNVNEQDSYDLGLFQVNTKAHRASYAKCIPGKTPDQLLRELRTRSESNMEGIIIMGMKILNDAYIQASKFIKGRDAGKASNAMQGISQLAYAYYNGGGGTKVSVEYGGVLGAPITVKPHNNDVAIHVRQFNGKLAEVIEASGGQIKV